MLADGSVTAFVPTSNLERAQEFFVGLLGLDLSYSDSFACVVRSGAVTVRVTLVPDFRPQQFTVLGWEVADVHAVIAELTERGISFLRFDGMAQDEAGVWTAPSGAQVAWFHDPDGNTLSVTQH
ncbi:VOC family protein [Smaragdicoccus niigatensis]|uniref:VOC family protein n=1 Tax=Smaragdicoccus niigatensis TaxID=359359 RepID=UPI0003636556|nr:VOC family protein [Smaragdicoccus niigatensis]